MLLLLPPAAWLTYMCRVYAKTDMHSALRTERQILWLFEYALLKLLPQLRCAIDSLGNI